MQRPLLLCLSLLIVVGCGVEETKEKPKSADAHKGDFVSQCNGFHREAEACWQAIDTAPDRSRQTLDQDKENCATASAEKEKKLKASLSAEQLNLFEKRQDEHLPFLQTMALDCVKKTTSQDFTACVINSLKHQSQRWCKEL